MTQPAPSQPNRRQFLGQSGAALAAGAVTSRLAFPSGAFAAANDETIKVGLVGCGGRGTGAASQALHTEGSVKLVAVGDAFQDRLESSLRNLRNDQGISAKIDVAEERKFVGFDAYRQVIESGVDVVILATPPGFRPLHFQAAVDAGKHVFMEKPVAVDGAGVRTVIEAARKATERNLKVGVGLQRRHQQNYKESIRQIQDGVLGDILASRVYWNGAGVWVRPRTQGQTEMEYQMRNWYYFNWLCGDHICEQHIHNLDVFNWVKNGHPVRAQGMGGREVRRGMDNGEIYDHFAVEYEYADGSRMFSYCRHIPNCWDSVSEHLIGTRGKADLGPGQTILSVTGQEPTRVRGRDNPYQTEHDVLFSAIRNGTPHNEAESGAHSSLTAVLGRLAVYSGQMVTWDQALNSPSLAPSQYAFNANPPVMPDAQGRYPIAIPGQFRV